MLALTDSALARLCIGRFHDGAPQLVRAAA